MEDTVLLVGLIGAAILSVCLFYIFRTIIIGAVGALVWIFVGAQSYAMSTVADDLYRLMAYFFFVVGALFSWEVWTDRRTEQRNAKEERMAEDLDDLNDQYEDAVDRDDGTAMAKLRRQIRKVEAGEREDEPPTVVEKVKTHQRNKAMRDFTRNGRW